MKLSIIILSYNTKELTLDCINAISQEYEKELRNGLFEVVLVDNASTDNSANAFKKLKIKNLKLIENKENYGFSKGNNLGAKQALGDYILFLNSDSEIKDKGFIRMLEFMESNKNVGIVGGRLKNPDNSVQKSAGKFYSLFNVILMLLGGERLGFLRSSASEISKINWVSGACMMVRKEIFKSLGGFEEKLFMYMEDMEFCFRAKKKGYLTYFYPNIELLHKEQGSSNRTFAIIHIYEGILFFYKKYMPSWQYNLVKKLLFLKALFIKNIGRIIGSKYYINTYGQALELLKK
ncbi:MAG: glycosyltransferase family 2 protein [Patescibacteria group bacterium]|nr:glycosyltransferase family 2 protein [Patescibacteria group bacterium]